MLSLVDLGGLGEFAEIDSGELDRFGAHRTEIVDARELLSLDALENLSLAPPEKSAVNKKAGDGAGALSA